LPQQQQQQQPQPTPPTGEALFSCAGLTVRRANGWMDGASECVQLDCSVEVAGGKSVRLELPPGVSVKQSWNCTPADGNTFGPPEWAAAGAGAGAPYVAGIVVTGGLPTGYSLV
jgi:hypothetical protein